MSRNIIKFLNIFTILVFLVGMNLRRIYLFYFDLQYTNTFIYCKNIVKFCGVTERTTPFFIN